MSITFFIYEDMNIQIDRPDSIKQYDEHIGNRVYEKLKGKHYEDEWTKWVDCFFKKHTITYKTIDDEEAQVLIKHGGEFTMRG